MNKDTSSNNQFVPQRMKRLRHICLDTLHVPDMANLPPVPLSLSLEG